MTCGCKRVFAGISPATSQDLAKFHITVETTPATTRNHPQIVPTPAPTRTMIQRRDRRRAGG